MRGLLAAAVIGASVAPQWYRDGALPEPEAALADVADCGIEGAKVQFDELLQADVVVLPGRADLSEEALSCLAQVSFDTGYEIGVPTALFSAFYQLREAVAVPWNRELALRSLAENGYSQDLPTIRADEAEADFARRIEVFCDARGALSSRFGPHAIDPDWLQGADRDMVSFGRAAMCLMSVGTAANFAIGFIGNERAAPKPD